MRKEQKSIFYHVEYKKSKCYNCIAQFKVRTRYKHFTYLLSTYVDSYTLQTVILFLLMSPAYQIQPIIYVETRERYINNVRKGKIA